MFGGRKSEAEEPIDDEGYEARFEYRTLAVIGVGNLDKQMNLLAQKGWELVSGSMAGTTHYAYMRRELKR